MRNPKGRGIEVLKVLFIAGSWGSGTTAVTGALDAMGIPSIPPYFTTNDPRTENSFESREFRKIVKRYADESTLRLIPEAKDEFKTELMTLIKGASPGLDDTLTLKTPLACLCLTEIIEVLDPMIVTVYRPLDEIEDSRLRRNWNPVLGAAGARVIYPTLTATLLQAGKSSLALSYKDLCQEPRVALSRITQFYDLPEAAARIEQGADFIRCD